MSLHNRPLPTVTLDSEPFWRSVKERAMKLQKCSQCSMWRYYPSPICHFCSSDQFTWEAVTGKGTIYSYSMLERANGNPFERDVPIVLVLVELEEGPVMMSNLIGYTDEDLVIDARVELDYGDIDDEITLPLFRPIGNPA